MDDANAARLDAHRNNIRRYRALLETPLTDAEREYIQRRLSEELAVLQDHGVCADGENNGGDKMDLENRVFLIIERNHNRPREAAREIVILIMEIIGKIKSMLSPRNKPEETTLIQKILQAK